MDGQLHTQLWAEDVPQDGGSHQWWRPGVRHKVVTPAPGSAYSTPAPSRGRCETPALLPREI